MIADLHNICTKFVLHDLLSFRGLFKLTEKKINKPLFKHLPINIQNN